MSQKVLIKIFKVKNISNSAVIYLPKKVKIEKTGGKKEKENYSSWVLCVVSIEAALIVCLSEVHLHRVYTGNEGLNG